MAGRVAQATGGAAAGSRAGGRAVRAGGQLGSDEEPTKRNRDGSRQLGCALVNFPEAEDDPLVLRPAPCQAGDIFVPDDPHGTLDSGSLACNGKPRNSPDEMSSGGLS